MVPHRQRVDVRVRSDPGRDLRGGVLPRREQNGKLDTGLFGIPTEGTVASNHAKGFMGPPTFDKAKFSFSGTVSELQLRMGY